MFKRLSVAALLLASLAGSAYYAGHRAQAQVVAQLTQERDAARSLATAQADAWEAAQQATTSHTQTTQALEQRYAQLSQAHQQLLNQRVPRLVRVAAPTACHAWAATQAPAPPPSSDAPAQQSPAPQPPSAALDLGADGELELSLGAVWLWNTALTGQPTAVGACNPLAKGPNTHTACAQASGLSFDAALANHTANAKTCQTDRERLNALVDFIAAKQTPAQGQGLKATPSTQGLKP